jgi:hypothetical protein
VLTGVHVQAFEEFHVHLGDSPGSFEQPIAVGVVADRGQQLAHEPFNALAVNHD